VFTAVARLGTGGLGREIDSSISSTLRNPNIEARRLMRASSLVYLARGAVKTPVVAAILGVLAASCTSAPDHERSFPAQTSGQSNSHGAVVGLQLVPIPEGPAAPSFERSAPVGDKFVRPLERVQAYMPDSFPTPLEQPADCIGGGNLVVTFADGFELTYGPCTRPASINRLWAGMIDVLDHGQCAPRCGPRGSAGR
jgi:hypothetical protein